MKRKLTTVRYALSVVTFSRNSCIWIAITLCAVLLLNQFSLHNQLFGSLFLLLYLLICSLPIKAIMERRGAVNMAWLWSIVSLVFGIALLGALIYYPYRLSDDMLSLLLLAPLALFVIKQPKFYHLSIPRAIRERSAALFWYALFLAASIGAVVLLHSWSTVDGGNSPWLLVPSWFFILYAGLAALLVWLTYTLRNRFFLFPAYSLFFFVSYTIAAAIYPLGFGFDGFIHRATELHILQHGFILPKQPVYIGQYALIVWLSKWTQMPIFYLDTYLVPVLAAVSLPPTWYSAYKRFFKLSGPQILVATLGVLVLFFLSLHLTTPHNVLILLTFLLTAAILLYHANQLPAWLLFVLSLGGMAIHPLLGAPLFGLVVVAVLVKQCRRPAINWGLIVLLAVGTAVIFPLMFTLYLLVGGHALPDLTNPLYKLDTFFALFRRPYWYEARAALGWELLYLFQWLVAPLVIIFGILGWWWQKHKRPIDYVLPAIVAGFWVGAWLLRSWIVFPEVGAFEQGDYPLRLLKSSLIFVLPFAVYGIYLLVKHLGFHPYVKKLLAGVGLPIILTAALYLSYPQENNKVHFPGYQVTQADFLAAQWIHEQEASYDYLVLSNPLTAVAAMTLYGFPRYFDTPAGQISYYSIPTGGIAFQTYQKLLYEGQKRSDAEALMDLVGVDKLYFVINSYWASFDKIVAGAQKTADSWRVIDGGKIWVFIYTR